MVSSVIAGVEFARSATNRPPRARLHDRTGTRAACGSVCRARLCRARHVPSARTRASNHGEPHAPACGDGVGGHRRTAASGASEDRTGPRNLLSPAAADEDLDETHGDAVADDAENGVAHGDDREGVRRVGELHLAEDLEYLPGRLSAEDEDDEQ